MDVLEALQRRNVAGARHADHEESDPVELKLQRAAV